MDVQLLTVVSEDEVKTWTKDEWAKWQIEPKYDGARLIYMNGQFLSRAGKPFHNIDHIKRELDRIDPKGEYVFDGELHGADWASTMSVARSSKTEKDGSGLVFHVFDLLPVENCKTNCRVLSCLWERQAHLYDLLNEVPDRKYVTHSHVYTVQTYQQFKSLYEQFLKQGCDGIVLKQSNSNYEFKRTQTWLKVKPVKTYDCFVVGMFEGKGKHAGRLGGLIVKPEGMDVETRVGTGFSNFIRDRYWKTRNDATVVGSVIEVEARGMHKSGRLIEPRFVRFRPDKEA